MLVEFLNKLTVKGRNNLGLFHKKEVEKDPKKAQDNVDKDLNKAVGGFFNRIFLGKDFQNQMKQAMEQVNEASELADSSSDFDIPEDTSALMQTGLPAKAEVVSIEDTGKTLNFNPVVKMNLKVVPQNGIPFEIITETVVSRIAIPRAGDEINVKYNPEKTSQILVL